LGKGSYACLLVRTSLTYTNKRDKKKSSMELSCQIPQQIPVSMYWLIRGGCIGEGKPNLFNVRGD